MGDAPDTDPLLFALEGSVIVEVFDASGNELVPLHAGSLLVIPRGRGAAMLARTTCWSCSTPPGQSLSCVVVVDDYVG